jgi:type I restriction enzyme M protein
VNFCKSIDKREPNGEEIVVEIDTVEKIRIGEKVIERPLKRREKIVDDDLPIIAEKYREFRSEYPEPGI